MDIHLAMLVIARRAIAYYWSVNVDVYMIGYVSGLRSKSRIVDGIYSWSIISN